MSDNSKPTFEQMCDPQWRRQQQISVKSEAQWVAFMELNGLINTAALSREYFKRSAGWLSQRINGSKVFGKPAEFRPEEYHQLAEAFRDIARRLQQHADEIDAAKLE
ncbi:MAG: DUF5053 domain-containing protein [Muribaculaceae bacterium]|nr:DUF5053 domain-containing protein [Muribaculaceae bacterium]